LSQRSGRTTLTGSELAGEARAPVEPVDALVGRRLGPYEVLRRVGSGGMGAVYEARDARGATVALKTLIAIQPTRLLALKREFRLISGLSHPRLVPVYELSMADGVWFLTMPLIHGDWFSRAVKDWRGVARGEGLLRERFAQLAEGVQALHGAGLLHFDLKPANVLVDQRGDVFLLDFGLARRAAMDEYAPRGGTPRYMSPEQARGQRLGPPADWYAVGVMLVEALGAVSDDADFDLRGAVAGLVGPPDLAELARRLVSPDPAARPSGPDVLRVFGRTVEAPPVQPPFVDRVPDRAELRRAWAESRDQPVLVRIEGASGFGKSALLAEFLEETARGSLLLRGRCYERERLPYRGLDVAIDELAFVSGAVAGRADLRRDPRMAAAARLFPTLMAAPASEDGALPDDPLRLRAAAIEGIKDLLRDLAVAAPVVLSIDDVHWGDADTARFLAGLLGPPAPPPILVVLTARSDLRPGPFLEELAALRPSLLRDLPEHRITLGPLPLDDARVLLHALRAPSPDEDELLQDAAGVPFLVEVLARAGAAGSGGARPVPPGSGGGGVEPSRRRAAGVAGRDRHADHRGPPAGAHPRPGRGERRAGGAPRGEPGARRGAPAGGARGAVPRPRARRAGGRTHPRAPHRAPRAGGARVGRPDGRRPGRARQPPGRSRRPRRGGGRLRAGRTCRRSGARLRVGRRALPSCP